MGANLDAAPATTRHPFSAGQIDCRQGSGHDVQLDRPETVIEAVRRMAAAVQAKQIENLRTTSDPGIGQRYSSRPAATLLASLTWHKSPAVVPLPIGAESRLPHHSAKAKQ
jgi:hypothetical protein